MLLSTTTSFIAVFFGGALGAVCRYGLNLAVVRLGIPPLIGTGFVNILGSFLIGVVAALIVRENNSSTEIFDRFHPFFVTGCLGGLTTFSTFSLEVFMLIQNGALMKAVLYTGFSVILAVLGVWIGIQVVR